MTPRIKFGLIVGAVGLVVNTLVAAAFGLCGPVMALLAGAAAGFFAAQSEKAAAKSDGARLGAVSGATAGALVFVGQLLGAAIALALVQVGKLPTIFGTAPSSADPIVQASFWLGGLGFGLCLGVGGIALAALAGAGTGYLGTPTQATITGGG
ncbi:MAG: hypothetical protein HY023_07725 [Chloroflexi bacterium]|nr:hypothetical protein [Chloroflexota bacterium]